MRVLFVLLFISFNVCSQGDSITSEDLIKSKITVNLKLPKSLQYETMLHPGDAFSGYTLKRGEFAYNQAITPYPSWAWWGITDRITAELDLEAWIGGVPSFNFRFGVLKQYKYRPALAFETMYQYLREERDQFHNLDYLQVLRQGSNWYNHVNLSWNIRTVLHIHLSGGATYADFLGFNNMDSINGVAREFNNLVSPDGSLGIDWRVKRWMGLHSTVSYGSTFLYADNIARKTQFTFAGRFAPFIGSKYGILNCFRFELAFLHARFADANESITGPIGFVYWQWDWSKERRAELKEKRKNK